MKAVGVKILKARLSEYLRLVKNGETVLVTERDEVIAELRPAHHQKLRSPSFREALEELADEGKVTLRASEANDWPSLRNLPEIKGVSSKDILDFQREDKK